MTGIHAFGGLTMLRAFALTAALWPVAAVADDLFCSPDTMCFDDDCQAGHDDHRAITLLDWQSASPVLHTVESDVTVTRRDKGGLMQWSGRNADNYLETLTFHPRNGKFSYEFKLEPESAVQRLTARGKCTVQPR